MYVVNKDGCPECTRGYKGRIAIQEVLMMNQSIRDAIVNNVRKDDLWGGSLYRSR